MKPTQNWPPEAIERMREMFFHEPVPVPAIRMRWHHRMLARLYRQLLNMLSLMHLIDQDHALWHYATYQSRRLERWIGNGWRYIPVTMAHNGRRHDAYCPVSRRLLRAARAKGAGR